MGTPVKIAWGLALITLNVACFCLADIRISAFNIQVFGQAKMGKPHVVESLVQILRQYDLVVIQEIRDSKQTAIYQLLDELNSASSDQYGIVLSARLGRTSSKEQYAFFYKQNAISVMEQYQFPDGDDVFEREPFAVRLKSGSLEFGMLGIHVKPDDAVSEIDQLTQVYNRVSDLWGVKDFLLSGDFNADCNYVRPDDWQFISLRTDQRFTWLIGDDADTTVHSTDCAYDRLVIAGDKMNSAFIGGSAKVHRFDTEQGLDHDTALEVSDHYPVIMDVRT